MQEQQVRIDKWLWAARFYKTRSLATQMVTGGKVHYNGLRIKPSKNVEIGAKLLITLGLIQKEVIVKELSSKRLSAPLAAELYSETKESIEKREQKAFERKYISKSTAPITKPNKKERRELLKLKHL